MLDSGASTFERLLLKCIKCKSESEVLTRVRTSSSCLIACGWSEGIKWSSSKKQVETFVPLNSIGWGSRKNFLIMPSSVAMNSTNTSVLTERNTTRTRSATICVHLKENMNVVITYLRRCWFHTDSTRNLKTNSIFYLKLILSFISDHTVCTCSKVCNRLKGATG